MRFALDIFSVFFWEEVASKLRLLVAVVFHVFFFCGESEARSFYLLPNNVQELMAIM